MKIYHASQSGQVALIVLLVMSLTLVIALSTARRTTQDIVRTTQISESAQIYSAAQSVAERDLTNILEVMKRGEDVTAPAALPEAAGGVSINQANVNSQILFPTESVQPLAEGEVLQVAIDGTLTLEWGESDNSCDDASLLISEFYENGGELRVRYTAAGPYGCGTSLGDSISPGVDGAVFNTRTTIPNTGFSRFVRIIPLYTATNLYVSGAASGEFVQIISTAVNERGELEETGAIEVTTTSLQAPGFLDYALYSGGSILKN